MLILCYLIVAASFFVHVDRSNGNTLLPDTWHFICSTELNITSKQESWSKFTIWEHTMSIFMEREHVLVGNDTESAHSWFDILFIINWTWSYLFVCWALLQMLTKLTIGVGALYLTIYTVSACERVVEVIYMKLFFHDFSSLWCLLIVLSLDHLVENPCDPPKFHLCIIEFDSLQPLPFARNFQVIHMQMVFIKWRICPVVNFVFWF